jgi:hypothetical protein
VHTRLRLVAALLAVLVFWPALTAAQSKPPADAPMPELPPRGGTVESLVPRGWTIEQRRQADFNRDGRTDALLLIRETADQGATPRRILLVALATAQPSGYARSAANGRLVPRDPSGQLEDPMADGEITVRPGGFDLKIGMMPATGSYLAATMRYGFRFEGGCFRLIGYDRAETHRGTLDTRDVSVNFLTGAVIQTTGNAQSNRKQTQRSRLSSNPRRCLEDLPSGWSFDPLATPR